MGMNNKTVLVTGAAGFLGSHLCDSLLARGHRVIGVDNLSYGSLDNLVEASRNPRFEFHKADVTDERHIRQVDRRSRSSCRVKDPTLCQRNADPAHQQSGKLESS